MQYERPREQKKQELEYRAKKKTELHKTKKNNRKNKNLRSQISANRKSDTNRKKMNFVKLEQN